MERQERLRRRNERDRQRRATETDEQREARYKTFTHTYHFISVGTDLVGISSMPALPKAQALIRF